MHLAPTNEAPSQAMRDPGLGAASPGPLHSPLAQAGALYQVQLVIIEPMIKANVDWDSDQDGKINPPSQVVGVMAELQVLWA